MKTIYILIENNWCEWEHDLYENIAFSEDKNLLEQIAAGLFLEAKKEYLNEFPNDVIVEDEVLRVAQRSYDEGIQYTIYKEEVI